MLKKLQSRKSFLEGNVTIFTSFRRCIRVTRGNSHHATGSYNPSLSKDNAVALKIHIDNSKMSDDHLNDFIFYTQKPYFSV